MSVAWTDTTDKLDADRLLEENNCTNEAKLNIGWHRSMTYDVAIKLTGCKLTSGVALADVSDATEFTDDSDDRTSDTGATPRDDSISSKSLKMG